MTMASPVPRGTMHAGKLSPSNDGYQGFDWTFQDRPMYEYRKLQHSPAMTPPLLWGKPEDSPPWHSSAMLSQGRPPTHHVNRPDDSWNANMRANSQPQPMHSAANTEQMCLMDLAKENVLLKRQLHDASVQIHSLRTILHSGMPSSPKGGKSKDEGKKNPNQTRFWTEDEHKRFVAAIRKFGPKDVKSISKAVRTRTPVQVRTHAQKYFLKIARDRKKHEVSDSTEGGESQSGSTFISTSELMEDEPLDEAAEAAVAAAVAASGEGGTSAAAAAAFVAASSESAKYANAMEMAETLGMALMKPSPESCCSTQHMMSDSGSADDGARFLGLRLTEDMASEASFGISGHEAN